MSALGTEIRWRRQKPCLLDRSLLPSFCLYAKTCNGFCSLACKVVNCQHQMINLCFPITNDEHSSIFILCSMDQVTSQLHHVARIRHGCLTTYLPLGTTSTIKLRHIHNTRKDIIACSSAASTNWLLDTWCHYLGIYYRLRRWGRACHWEIGRVKRKRRI